MTNSDYQLKVFARESLEALGFDEPFFSDNEASLAEQFGMTPSGADTAWRWFNSALLSISRGGNVNARELRRLAAINRAMGQFRQREGKLDTDLFSEADKLELLAEKTALRDQ